jgi:hypothetical protein
MTTLPPRTTNPSHGRPAEQRERQGHGHVPLDPDEERAREREPQYRGDVVGGVTFDRGRNIENERPATTHPPLKGDEQARANEDADRRQSLEDARRTEPSSQTQAPRPSSPTTHETERKRRERGSIHKVETHR